MSAIIRIDQNARRSRASVFGDLVFLAGQVADDKSGDIASQTRQALAKVDDMLSRAGTDKSRLLSVQ
ncbi:Rid family hydrolase, partial [Stenotrophomonas maltophilia]|uniref:Rid family hydrolase n=1 Tax=Stenotrophomonas maltophilia TaxID=40324 RepID=UPI001EF7976D